METWFVLSFFADALASLREVCAFVSPNDGFLDQVRCCSSFCYQFVKFFIIFLNQCCLMIEMCWYLVAVEFF
jgi:hypothetical protein